MSRCRSEPLATSSTVTGGGVKLVVPQLLRSTRQVIAMIQIASLLISQSNSKDRRQLEIRFILGVRRLRKGGHGHEPVLAAIGSVRHSNKIAYLLLIAPSWHSELMMHL